MSNARERLVETTRKLLHRQGYHATGLNQIVDESDAPKGSLYHYFPGGKEELAVEAVRQSSNELHELTRAALAHTRTAHTFLRLLANGMIEKLQQSSFEEACPISTVALETAARSPALQQACSEGYARERELLAEGLKRDGYGDAEAAELAMLLQSAWLGALLLSRTHQNTAPLESIVRTISRLIPGT